MNNIRLALIGCGPHAKKVYLPTLKRLRYAFNIDLVQIVELKSNEEKVKKIIEQEGINPELFLVDSFTNNIPYEIEKNLSKRASQLKVDGVIIATEPLVHKAYSKWALKHHLHILLDKPITTRINVTSDINNAKGIIRDFDELLTEYKLQQQYGELVFMVNAQRRAHPGFRLVEQLLREVGQQTNCPVTSLQSYHCDGQWRFPSEIVTQTYHPYCQGYGKASHSGYHIFDMMYKLFVASGVAKKPNSMEVVSSFVQPQGFIKQITQPDYQLLFGNIYDKVNLWDDHELRDLYTNFGEIDLSGIVTLKHDQDVVANLSVNLLHNGFAQRTWVTPGNDLYKGNGRVKHEHYNIQQGPFQNIQIHSYQSNDKHNDTSEKQDELGGNNHFDIHVFRNPLVTGKPSSLQIYKWNDILTKMSLKRSELLTSEFAKYQLIEQFIRYLAGKVKKDALPSLLEDHHVPVQIMSGLYQSHILRQLHMDCIVRMGVFL